MVFNDTISVDLNKPLARSRAVLASDDNMANCFVESIYADGKPVDISGHAERAILSRLTVTRLSLQAVEK